MKSILIKLSFFIFSLLHVHAANAQDNESSVNIGIIYPLSTLGLQSKDYSSKFSFHVIGGYTRAELAFAASGFANVVKEDAQGFQGAGFANVFGGQAQGFTVSGFLNFYGAATGFQGSGFANYSEGNVKGVQMAGFLNKANNISGVQGSGFINMSDSLQGTQIAGFMNMAGDVDGAQIASFINIARNVKGIQIGIINIGDSVRNAIGLVNISKNGEQQISLSVDDNASTVLAFRSGRRLYGIVGAGYNFNNKDEVYVLQYGIGAHFIRYNHFKFSSELVTTHVSEFKSHEFYKVSLQLLPSLELGKWNVFAGPSVNFVSTNSEEGRNLVNDFLWDEHKGSGRIHGMYIGYVAGLQYRLSP